jgi:Flp pilus assembly protein TadB
MTLLVVAITVLLFVVLWQLFTLTVAVVVVAGVLIGMTVYRLSLRRATRRGVESQGRHG